MRTLPQTAGAVLAALCVTACEADSVTGLGKVDAKPMPAIAVAPASLSLQIYAFVPERDAVPQSLSVTNWSGPPA